MIIHGRVINKLLKAYMTKYPGIHIEKTIDTTKIDSENTLYIPYVYSWTLFSAEYSIMQKENPDMVSGFS